MSVEMGVVNEQQQKAFNRFFWLLEIKRFCQFLSLNKIEFLLKHKCVLCVGVDWI